MAAMTTSLTEFSDNGNSRQYTLSDHSVSKPRSVIQKRKVPTGNQQVAEDSIFIFSGTADAEGNPLTARASVEIVLRRPVNGDAGDLDDMVDVARDIIASDEFTSLVSTQNWLK